MSSSMGSLESLRVFNRDRVRRLLSERGTVSRAEIATSTGLSRSLVSSIVGELLAEGELVEHPQPPGGEQRPGRPTRLISLDPTSGVFLGIRLSHLDIRLVLLDRAGTQVAAAREAVGADWTTSQTTAAIRDRATQLLADDAPVGARLLGAGLAVSAPLVLRPEANQKDTEAGGPAGVAGLAGSAPGSMAGALRVASELSESLALPLEVANDANLGGLAEARLGAGRGVAQLLYVMLSVGVGGAVLLNGELYLGAHTTAGELGHALAVPDGLLCRCGNRGCLETVAGLEAILAPLRSRLGPEVTLDDVALALRAGDPGVAAVVSAAGQAVGRALAPLCLVLDPGLVLLGGDVAALGEPLLAAARSALSAALPPHARASYALRRGQFGVHAEALGAAAWVMGRPGVAGRPG